MACRPGFMKYYHGIHHRIIALRGCNKIKKTIQSWNVCLFSTGRKNYYDVLELSPQATPKDIKKAYYRLSKEYHPDVNKDQTAVQKFRELSEAYEVLGNSISRKEYDSNMFRHPDQNLNELHRHEHHSRQRSAWPFRGRTTYYDYDEWFQQHYANEEFKRRERSTGTFRGRTTYYDDDEWFRQHNANEEFKRRERSTGPFPGRTTYHDYDEWLQQHYANEEFKRRQWRKQEMYQQQRKATYKSLLLTSFLSTLTMLFFLNYSYQGYSRISYDSRMASSDKKK